MRILIIGPVLPYLGGRTTGGVAMDCTNQALFLSKNNTKVAVIAHNTFSKEKSKQYQGIKIYYFPVKSLIILHAIYNLIFNDLLWKLIKYTGIKGIFKAFKILGRIYTIGHIIDIFKPDIIHIHDIDYFPEVKLSNKNKIPIIATIHSLSALNPLYTKKSEIPIHKKIYKKSIPQLEYIVTVSEYLRKEIKKHFCKDTYIINNPVDYKLGNNESEHITNKNNKKRKLVFVGHLKKGKGVYDLINVACLLKNKLDFHLTIVGEGEERDSLIKEIRNRNLGSFITLMGRISHRDVFKYLNSSDLFVTCSHGETWGNVFFEAFSVGLPVVAYDNTVMKEVIPNYAGLLAKNKNIEEFSKKVIIALNNKWNKKKIIKYALEHSWENRINDFIYYYNYILENEKNKRKKLCKD